MDETTSAFRLFKASELDAGKACFGLMDLANPCEIAVRSSAYVEVALTKALIRRCRGDLTANERSDVFEMGGPIGAFSSKIWIGFAFGLFDRDIRYDLNLVKEVRKEFAHHLLAIDFTYESVTRACNSLRCPRVEWLLPAKPQADAVERFKSACFILAAVLGQSVFSYEKGLMAPPEGGAAQVGSPEHVQSGAPSSRRRRRNAIAASDSQADRASATRPDGVVAST